MDIINVDDFNTEELAAGQQPVELRQVRVSNA
jgi:hypothetical protein